MAQEPFEQLEQELLDIGTALDDPDTKGTPEQFLEFLRASIATCNGIAQSLTVDDFQAAYDIDDGDDDETENNVFAFGRTGS